MAIIDTHVHIDQLQDLPGSIDRARQAGVSDIVGMSVDIDSMKKILSIMEEYQQPKIHLSLGVHPGMVESQDLKAVGDFISTHRTKAVAIGETGLDYWYKWVRRNLQAQNRQKDFFALHCDWALAWDLPIVIHSRGAWSDCVQMTKAKGVKRALFHWYSGPEDILEDILEAGFYVSTAPSLAYSPESRRAMDKAPLERILIETDSPVRYKEGEETFCAEPRDVLRTLKALAQLKNIDEEETQKIVNTNAKNFFRI